MQLSETCTTFSLVAILVACLGLFGLASYSAEQRRKEIGIRKFLGATLTSIVGTFTRDFVRLVVIANLVAGPIAFYLMRGWLEGFAYRMDLTPLPFLLCGLATLAIALVPVSYQALKVGSAKIVDALRWE